MSRPTLFDAYQAIIDQTGKAAIYPNFEVHYFFDEAKGALYPQQQECALLLSKLVERKTKNIDFEKEVKEPLEEVALVNCALF